MTKGRIGQILVMVFVLLLSACAFEAPVRTEGSTPAPTKETKYAITVNGTEYMCQGYSWGKTDPKVVVLYKCIGYLGTDIVIDDVTSFSVEEIQAEVPLKEEPE